MSIARSRRLAAGALMIGIPASAVAVTAGQAVAAADTVDMARSPAADSIDSAAPPAPGTPLQIDLQSRRIAYGHDVVVTGTAPAGETVALEFAPAGGSGWRQISSTTVTGTGQFRLAGPLERSGAVEAIETPGGSTSSGGMGAVTSADPAASAARPVEVTAALRVGARQIGVLSGQTVVIAGRLLPKLAGRKVVLQGLQDGSWQPLATARTGAGGSFRLRYAVGAPGQKPIRVRFAGDQTNGRSQAPAGQLTVYRAAVASWYDDAGDTACGFHAYYGVANRTLPCGTQVAMRYNGRSVIATVDDRGPYVAGRDWDLNQNTAAALGFDGVGTIWSSQ